jgi:hypothetical protein
MQWFSNPTEEGDKLKAAFMAGAFEFAKHSKTLLDFTAAAKSIYPSVSSWGTFGLCWGGKVRLSKSPISLLEFVS